MGHIGSKVRRIVKSAKFPVLITSPVYKEWKSVAVLFGGSSNSVKALKLGIRVARETGMPLEIFTQIEKNVSKSSYEKIVKDENLDTHLSKFDANWIFFENRHHPLGNLSEITSAGCSKLIARTETNQA